jgi:hypothetical protein
LPPQVKETVSGNGFSLPGWPVCVMLPGSLAVLSQDAVCGGDVESELLN